VIVLGIILLIVGWALTIPVLWTIGIILVLIGVALWVMGSVGHAVGGRRHYF
jgi:fatty-acid desaturase